MINNDILRRVRYALNINDSAMIEIFKQADYQMPIPELVRLLKKDDEPGFVECSDIIMEYFLNGLIYSRRGKIESKQGQEKNPASQLSNNTILKKLRIALELREEDMLDIMELSDMKVSKSELTALFRKEGHKNYKDCGDQFLRNFIKGITIRFRSI
ncbi:YehS family protein [Desulforegula conservatrix]|uniref:DUF1456 family protein n=1 Tax=Desulforegula conservatrix TaxID=153026 RepID=UPI000429F91D|nr:DUF1456 family protein [Desulforegula conservatrix]